MHKQLKKLWKEIEELPHDELFDLLKKYDRYVIEITDREDGSVPVCVLEFYQNEWQDMREYNKDVDILQLTGITKN